ncbi:hypothetical protein DPMN_034012 [Dreissena polymorpha]|uniref:Uncharacterized protein n=1 Tax=Dreissena polymorpha TaxID=45954 RepID=A0A9D4M854_DREPO|nr:hypothetical protein DPMN_034012 [Dreissena polymorpha]
MSSIFDGPGVQITLWVSRSSLGLRTYPISDFSNSDVRIYTNSERSRVRAPLWIPGSSLILVANLSLSVRTERYGGANYRTTTVHCSSGERERERERERDRCTWYKLDTCRLSQKKKTCL